MKSLHAEFSKTTGFFPRRVSRFGDSAQTQADGVQSPEADTGEDRFGFLTHHSEI